MGADSRSAPERIEAAFRQGAITVVAILTAFSPGFLTAQGTAQ